MINMSNNIGKHALATIHSQNPALTNVPINMQMKSILQN